MHSTMQAFSDTGRLSAAAIIFGMLTFAYLIFSGALACLRSLWNVQDSMLASEVILEASRLEKLNFETTVGRLSKR